MREQNAALGNLHSLIAVGLLCAGLACAACAPQPIPTPTETASPTPTDRFPTHAGPIIRATLPPAWTLTYTPLPTLTPTPTPVTPTATATPLPSLSELCDSFTVDTQFQDGDTFGWNDTLSMVFGTTLSAVRDPASGNAITLVVRFLATRPADGENLGVQLDGGQVSAIQLPVDQLPGPGDYDWKVAVYGDGIGEQCVHAGSFVVTRSAADLLTATALAAIPPTPAPTVAVTEDGTIIPIFQNILPGGSG